MTDAPDIAPEDAADLLAAEYVLGVLDLPARTAAEARIARDPAFADLVQAWENRLSGLNDEYEDMPPPYLLRKVEARLFPEVPKPQRNWFGWLAGAATAAVMVIGFLVLVPGPPQLGTTLAAAGQPLAFSAVFDPGSDSVTLSRTSGPGSPEGQDYELWAIGADGVAVSLGLIREARITARLPGGVPDLAAGQTLAISLEPAGGSPTGQPTGPVLVTGTLAEL